MPISKLEAAERQLNCAIRVYFGLDDACYPHIITSGILDFFLTSILTAHRTILPATSKRPSQNWAGVGSIRVANFLKHADKDPEDLMDDLTEAARSLCFLNSLNPSLIRVGCRKKIERTKRKIGIAATMKAMILKIIVHSF
jgi:hypothetical protein